MGDTENYNEVEVEVENEYQADYVIKRDGRKETVSFDKITSRIQKLSYGINSKHCNPIHITQKTIEFLKSGITTSELDELAAQTAASNSTTHPDYSKIAARIVISNLHKNTEKSFSKNIKKMYNCINPKTGKNGSLISEETLGVVNKNADILDGTIIYDRDFNYDYFGYKTLEKSYLKRINEKVVERPQHMIMRVAVGIWDENIEDVIRTYHEMSQGWYTHATPTLYNAGTPNPQMSSCFLIAMKDDSISGIFKTLGECADISKNAGGEGIHIHNVRATRSYIVGTNGHSNGIIPMLRVFNETARYVDQGGGKRKGSFAIYLEPWHADIFEFLDIRKNHGNEEYRARDLFTALWIPDLFMKRVEEENGEWSLFCPNEAPGLADVYGEEFDELYNKYENTAGLARKTIKARELFNKILESQIETGTPYMLYKDSANRKSNQKNLGTIKSSNLCCEIVEYSSPDETAVCNLASICLPKFVKTHGEFSLKNKEIGSLLHDKREFDFDKLIEITSNVTRNLNRVIDKNFYPVETARRSNMRHRPIGIGVQGLADTFILLGLPFESEEAKKLNKDIFEAIYYGALKASCELAKVEGVYETYEGSPISKGIIQPDMWDIPTPNKSYLNWIELRENIMIHGVRNSLLVAPMPTASTAQILGNNECFEPITSNIYTRRVLSGEYIVVNNHLIKDLCDKGLWNEELKNKLIYSKGSIQNISQIPEDIRNIYKTVWEIKQKNIVDMAKDRGAYIDQSQSMNIHMINVNHGKLTSMHFAAWKAGLKTGMYYLRTKAATDAIQFTVDKSKLSSSSPKRIAQNNQDQTNKNQTNKNQTNQGNYADMICSLENREACDACGS